MDGLQHSSLQIAGSNLVIPMYIAVIIIIIIIIIIGCENADSFQTPISSMKGVKPRS